MNIYRSRICKQKTFSPVLSINSSQKDKDLYLLKLPNRTCILIEGTFPSMNQHSCIFSCFKRPSMHLQDALENVFTQRETIFTHKLTLDESNSRPSRPTVLYV